MNITVITPYDHSNYGAFLQAYCLKIQLEKMGHKVNHIPTRDDEYVKELYYRDKPKLKKEKLFRWKFEQKRKYGIRKRELFLEDQKAFNVVHPENNKADLYILGSDEIWNINQPVFREPVFWGAGISPVMSYAASIGSASVEDFDGFPEQVNAIRKLSAVLVRDERTKEFVNKYSDCEAKTVCDPTMLVPVSEYGREFTDSYLQENNCLLIYAYKLKKEFAKSIQSYAKKNNMKTVACCFYHDWCDYQCECGPLQFSALIRQCKGVITTTFHGSVFSILNHADFVSIPTSPKTNQLLCQFGLDDRLLPENELSVESLGKIFGGKKINYDEVEEKIEAFRANSIELLDSSIKSAALNKKVYDYQICPSDSCTGCFACMNKCPKQAISCITDRYGRTLPQINSDKCVKCGLCKKVCPENTNVELVEPQRCYAAQRPKKELRKQSASGGIGALLTEHIIENGGVVYGAAVEKGNPQLRRPSEKNSGRTILKLKRALEIRG